MLIMIALVPLAVTALLPLRPAARGSSPPAICFVTAINQTDAHAKGVCSWSVGRVGGVQLEG